MFRQNGAIFCHQSSRCSIHYPSASVATVHSLNNVVGKEEQDQLACAGTAVFRTGAVDDITIYARVFWALANS